MLLHHDEPKKIDSPSVYYDYKNHTYVKVGHTSLFLFGIY